MKKKNSGSLSEKNLKSYLKKLLKVAPINLG